VRVISRFEGAGVEVFDTELNLVHTFPMPPFTEIEGYAVARAKDRVAYVTPDMVACVDREGNEVWRQPLPPMTGDGIARANCAFSSDDRFVWVYAPDMRTGLGGNDQWIVLDAATGAEHERHSLPDVAGQGGSQFSLADGRMLLDVGEGQDGSQSFLGGPSAPMVAIGWGNQVPIDLSPDETQILTVDHDQQDATFYDISDFPNFRVLATVDVPDHDSIFEWTGGYLDASTAILVITDDESWRHVRVDPRTGAVLGELPVSTVDEYDLQPLGDGTFVITDTDGTLRRM
jgi:hypothetical protein